MSIETRWFDEDAFLGTRKLFHYDHAEDVFHIETVLDAEPLLDLNKRQFNDRQEFGTRRAPDMTKVASIPMPLYWQLKEQGIMDDEKRFAAWLNDPDNRLFRTAPGRV